MEDLILSLSKNQLRLSSVTKTGLTTSNVTLDSNVSDDTKILDTNALVDVVRDSISQMGVKKNASLVFLVEPSDVVFRFVTLDKNTDDTDTAILEDVSQKLDGIELSDLYFSHQKIAPFVYQFLGIRKELIDQHLEISNSLGMSLKAVIPWLLVLPKYLKTNDPCVFMLKTQNKHIVALAELNGIYFCESFERDTSSEQVQFIVQKLSVYKRDEPIKKIYALDKADVTLEGNYEVISLSELLEIDDVESGFEPHFLARMFFVKRPELLSTQVNLLNLLPVPVVVEKSKSLVYVGAAVSLVLVLGGLFSFYKYSTSTSGEVASISDSEVSVPQQEPVAPPVEQPTEEKKELDIKTLSVKIENGAGIPGIAGSAQTYLEGKGYTVSEIGNSDTSDYQKTTLRFKSSAKDYTERVNADMQGEYTTAIGEELDDSFGFDVLIIIGAN